MKIKEIIAFTGSPHKVLNLGELLTPYGIRDIRQRPVRVPESRTFNTVEAQLRNKWRRIRNKLGSDFHRLPHRVGWISDVLVAASVVGQEFGVVLDNKNGEMGMDVSEYIRSHFRRLIEPDSANGQQPQQIPDCVIRAEAGALFLLGGGVVVSERAYVHLPGRTVAALVDDNSTLADEYVVFHREMREILADSQNSATVPPDCQNCAGGIHLPSLLTFFVKNGYEAWFNVETFDGSIPALDALNRLVLGCSERMAAAAISQLHHAPAKLQIIQLYPQFSGEYYAPKL